MTTFLFIDGLPDDITHEQVRALFAPYGTALAVVIARRPHSGFLPFGFVVMAEMREADAARSALNGSICGERTLRLDSTLTPPFGWVRTPARDHLSSKPVVLPGVGLSRSDSQDH